MLNTACLGKQGGFMLQNNTPTHPQKQKLVGGSALMPKASTYWYTPARNTGEMPDSRSHGHLAQNLNKPFTVCKTCGSIKQYITTAFPSKE